MNRYEILIGKAPPAEPPKPPEPPKVREILLGKRRSGKTSELINCIRKTVEKGSIPLVCLSHEPDYFLWMAGRSLAEHTYLTSPERLCSYGGFGDVKAFYYDDFDLVRFRKEEGFDRFGLEKYSLDRRFVEMDEIVVTCDVQEMRKYCQLSRMDSVPPKFRVGFNIWEVIDIPRRSNDMIYTFNQSYLGKFI